MRGRSEETAAGATERLRRAGLRVTAARLAVLSLLGSERRHPTAEQVHATLHPAHPSLSLSTVYGTLDAFVRAGLCRRVRSGDGRMRVDGTAVEHDHAVCRGCGRIFDVERGGIALPPVPARLPRGLTVGAVRIEYDVICSSCLRGPKHAGGHDEDRRSRSAGAGGARPASRKKERKEKTPWRS